MLGRKMLAAFKVELLWTVAAWERVKGPFLIQIPYRPSYVTGLLGPTHKTNGKIGINTWAQSLSYFNFKKCKISILSIHIWWTSLKVMVEVLQILEIIWRTVFQFQIPRNLFMLCTRWYKWYGLTFLHNLFPRINGNEHFRRDSESLWNT